MIEDFVKLIPPTLMDVSGSVFLSGRKAFGAPSDLYILDYHPGGDPKEETETIKVHTDKVLKERDDWTSWIDAEWRHPKGEHPTQKKMLYLFDKIKLNPREVPGGSLIFQRSNEDLPKKMMWELAKLCWPCHEDAIRRLKVKVVVCLGIRVGEFVSGELDAQLTDDCFTEKNSRGWKSRTYKSPCGLYVVALVNPKRSADWRKSEESPIGLVQRALEKIH